MLFFSNFSTHIFAHASLQFKLKWQEGRLRWCQQGAAAVAEVGPRNRADPCSDILQGFSPPVVRSLEKGQEGAHTWGNWMHLASFMEDLTANVYLGSIEKQKSQHGSRKRRSWLNQRGQQTWAPKASPWRLPISLTPCVQLLISLNNPASLWNFSSEALHAHDPDRSSSWRRHWRHFSRRPRNPKVPVYPE